MSAPLREVRITFRRDAADRYGPALAAWTDAEPTLSGFELGLPDPNGVVLNVRAWLQPVWVVDGPAAGTWAKDRPRAVTLLRQLIPAEFVESATVEGIDWKQ